MFIHVVNGREILFDSEEDYDLVTTLNFGGKRRKIWISEAIGVTKRRPYASIWLNDKNVKVHHVLMGNPLNGRMIDHFNGNPLDNRRSNLRNVTRSQNQYNKPSTKGVNRWITERANGKFAVRFAFNVGTFSTIEEAQQAAKDFIKEKDIQIYEGFL